MNTESPYVDMLLYYTKLACNLSQFATNCDKLR